MVHIWTWPSLPGLKPSSHWLCFLYLSALGHDCGFHQNFKSLGPASLQAFLPEYAATCAWCCFWNRLRSFRNILNVLVPLGPQFKGFCWLQVIDLLNPSHRRYLSVRWSKNKGFYVENLFSMECETLDDLMAVLEEGDTLVWGCLPVSVCVLIYPLILFTNFHNSLLQKWVSHLHSTLVLIPVRLLQFLPRLFPVWLLLTMPFFFIPDEITLNNKFRTAQDRTLNTTISSLSSVSSVQLNQELWH